jgi:hypothetical protein
MQLRTKEIPITEMKDFRIEVSLRGGTTKQSVSLLGISFRLI